MASWLVAHAAHHLDLVVAALRASESDAIALQSVKRSHAEQIAHELDLAIAWELSHHPASRLIPGSGVGLAVLSPHDLHDSVSVVTNNHSSPWSTRRRIAQLAVVRRDDGSAFTVGHAVAAPDPQARGVPPAPLVWFRPPQVGVDIARAVELPTAARLVDHEVAQPVADAPKLLMIRFDWHGDDVAAG